MYECALVTALYQSGLIALKLRILLMLYLTNNSVVCMVITKYTSKEKSFCPCKIHFGLKKFKDFRAEILLLNSRPPMVFFITRLPTGRCVCGVGGKVGATKIAILRIFVENRPIFPNCP